MSMSSYLISHNYSLYVLLTGTRKIMAIQGKPGTQSGIVVTQEVYKSFTKELLSPKEKIALSEFLKDMEGTADSQSKSKEPTYNPSTKTFTPYEDTGGVMTIGYGFTEINGKKVKAGDTMSLQEAEEYLRNTIDSKALAVETHLRTKYEKGLGDMTPNAKLIAVEKAFNIGPKAFVVGDKAYKLLIPALFNDDWRTINKEVPVSYKTIDPETGEIKIDPETGKPIMKLNERRNKGIYKNFIERKLDTLNLLSYYPEYIGKKSLIENQQRAKPDTSDKVEQSDKYKQFEEEARRRKDKVEKGIYKSLPSLLHSIQTKTIPTDKVKDYMGAYASSELYKAIKPKIPQIVEDLKIKGKIKDLDEYEFSLLGYKFRQEPDKYSVSGKGFTFTQTDKQKRLEKEFGKKGDITGSIGISKSDVGDEKTIGGQINIPTHKIKEFITRRKRK
jgi:GH24 family phage-related lysozyme (muramidase)